MHTDTRDFLHTLQVTAPANTYLTLSVIHPATKRTAHRHILATDTAHLHQSVCDLHTANALGWGGYIAMGYRKRDLGRWKRGGAGDIVALPALFADVDRADALPRLQAFVPSPSWIVASGGGFHAYWWLDIPLTDGALGITLLHAIATVLGGDRLSVAQSMRLVGTRNTKPHRHQALCHVLVANSTRHRKEDFYPLMPRASPTYARYQPRKLNPHLIHAITERLITQYGGTLQRNGWLACCCPLPHTHDSVGQHFFFKPDIGFGICHGKHGAMRLDALCAALSVHSQDYGGLYEQTSYRDNPRA